MMAPKKPNLESSDACINKSNETPNRKIMKIMIIINNLCLLKDLMGSSP